MFLRLSSTMKPEQMYQGLKDLADRLGIVISEQKLTTESLKIKSGLCKIRGRFVMILDKQLPVYKKCAVLATCLSDLPIEDIFVIPAVREFLANHRKPVNPEKMVEIPEDGTIYGHHKNGFAKS